MIKIFFIVLMTLIASLLFFLFWAQSNSLKPGYQNQKISTFDHNTSFYSHDLKVMTWNFAFAYGIGSEGVGYKPLTKDEYIQHLDQAAELIRSIDPDILFIQEIDFHAHRSYEIDQLEYLAKKLKYSYAAYAKSWEHNYIPFPYWPISHQFKKMSSGGGVLSKYEIVKNEVFLFDKPKTNPWWYNLFYLYRYFQTITIKRADAHLVMVNVHLEAFDKNKREEESLQLIQEISGKKPLIVAGDFNSTPENASQKINFKDYPDDHYDNDSTINNMLKNGFKDFVGSEEYKLHEQSWFTFPAGKLDRKLDYVFSSNGLEVKEKKVMNQNISDHDPVVVIFNFVK